MKKYTLTAEPRTILGSKVKVLRKQKLIPANIFGNKIKSTAITIKNDEFLKVFREAGETAIIDVALGSETRPVLVKNAQVHPVTGKLLHVDLYQVDMKQKVTANVPLQVEGSAPAVDNKLGVLLELMSEVEVEALPMDLPEHINVDVKGLDEVGKTITVADLKAPTGVEILTEKEKEVAKIGELVTKEAEAQAEADAAAEAAATAASADAGATAGAPATEAAGATPAADSKPAEKK